MKSGKQVIEGYKIYLSQKLGEQFSNQIIDCLRESYTCGLGKSLVFSKNKLSELFGSDECLEEKARDIVDVLKKEHEINYAWPSPTKKDRYNLLNFSTAFVKHRLHFINGCFEALLICVQDLGDEEIHCWLMNEEDCYGKALNLDSFRQLRGNTF